MSGEYEFSRHGGTLPNDEAFLAGLKPQETIYIRIERGHECTTHVTSPMGAVPLLDARGKAKVIVWDSWDSIPTQPSTAAGHRLVQDIDCRRCAPGKTGNNLLATKTVQRSAQVNAPRCVNVAGKLGQM